MPISKNDSLLLIRSHYREQSKLKLKNDRISRGVPPIRVPPHSADDAPRLRRERVSASPAGDELWMVNKTNAAGEKRLQFVATKNPKRDYLNVGSYIQMQYCHRVPCRQFFDQLAVVRMGDSDPFAAADYVYHNLPSGQRLDFIGNLKLAELRQRENKSESLGSLGRETGLVSALFRTHFLNLYGAELNKLLRVPLKVLQDRLPNGEEEAVLQAVDSVLRILVEKTKTEFSYDIKRLYRQLYQDCRKHKNESFAREQIVGKFFLILINPILVDQIKDNSGQPQLHSAAVKVSKIIQNIANETKPRSGGVGFAFEEPGYSKKQSMINEIILNLTSLG